jgi:hypothetical protein
VIGLHRSHDSVHGRLSGAMVRAGQRTPTVVNTFGPSRSSSDAALVF